MGSERTAEELQALYRFLIIWGANWSEPITRGEQNALVAIFAEIIPETRGPALGQLALELFRQYPRLPALIQEAAPKFDKLNKRRLALLGVERGESV